MNDHPALTPQSEHSVPLFWPLAPGVEMGAAGLALLEQNLGFLAADPPPPAQDLPRWSSPNTIVRDLPTLRLRDFSAPGDGGPRVLVVPPHMGHSAAGIDIVADQSLVATLRAQRIGRVTVVDWKQASPGMYGFGLAHYLADLGTLLAAPGEPVVMVGLCQGGWLAAASAARAPETVAALVLAGAPIDIAAGGGPLANTGPVSPGTLYPALVRQGAGCLPGASLLAGWKNLHPHKRAVGTFLDLYAHLDGFSIGKDSAFTHWFETVLDLPGRYVLELLEALATPLDLRGLRGPAYLLAGHRDPIAPRAQVFGAAEMLGTAPEDITRKLAPGGHLALLFGSTALRDTWPGIAAWIKEKAVTA